VSRREERSHIKHFAGYKTIKKQKKEWRSSLGTLNKWRGSVITLAEIKKKGNNFSSNQQQQLYTLYAI